MSVKNSTFTGAEIHSMLVDLEDIENESPERTSGSVTVFKSTKNISKSNISIYLKTWGCSHNNSDTEYMAGLLATDGYHIILDGTFSITQIFQSTRLQYGYSIAVP